MRVQPHPSGLDALSVVIEPTARTAGSNASPVDYGKPRPKTVRELLQAAGVVGLAAPSFPTHGKLHRPSRCPWRNWSSTAPNASRSSPATTSDARTGRRGGARASAFSATCCSPRRPHRRRGQQTEAIAAPRSCGGARMNPFGCRPHPLPGGGAKQLIRVLTGKKCPPAFHRSRRPVLQRRHRLYRLAGHRPRRTGGFAPCHPHRQRPPAAQLRSPDRHPMDELVRRRPAQPDTDGIIMGGPMMGFVPDRDAPVVKATNCLIAHSDRLFPPPRRRCPASAAASALGLPHELQPFELYWFACARISARPRNTRSSTASSAAAAPSSARRAFRWSVPRFAKSEIWARSGRKRRRRRASALRVQAAAATSGKKPKRRKTGQRRPRRRAKKAAEAAAAAAEAKTDQLPSEPLTPETPWATIEGRHGPGAGPAQAGHEYRQPLRRAAGRGCRHRVTRRKPRPPYRPSPTRTAPPSNAPMSPPTCSRTPASAAS